MLENRVELFKSQLAPLIKLLQCEAPNISTYNELAINTFNDRNICREALLEQLIFFEAGIKLIESDVSIINTPAGHDRLFRVLKQSFLDMKSCLINEVDEIFEQYGE